ncbi:MAG: hypothetical protein ACR2NZ_07425 [Rubripirellula sp.]
MSQIDARFDGKNVIAVFDADRQTAIVTFGAQVGYMPIQINVTVSVGGTLVTDVEMLIRWQKSGKYWLPDQIKYTGAEGQHRHVANDMSVAWKTGDAAPKFVVGKADYRAVIMESYRKPFSQIVDGKVVPRPWKKGRKTLFPLSIERLPFAPTAGEASGDNAAVREAFDLARQAEQTVLRRFAVLIESECFKDTTNYSPVFTNRWAEQRIYSQLDGGWKYGAYNQISGPKKNKHAWEELLIDVEEIRFRSDLAVFPPGDLRRATPYTGKPERFSKEQFLRFRYRVTPFYPAAGCFGGQNVFNIGWDVSAGIVRGELVATRRFDDGTVRSYWQYVDTVRKPPIDVCGVLVHDPEANFMPTQAEWYGSYPSRVQTEWKRYGDSYLPTATRVIRPIGSGASAGEMHQVNIYRWLIDADAPDSVFDGDLADLRSPVMELFDRPFTRTTVGNLWRTAAVYETPEELAELPDPPNEANDAAFSPFD